MIETERTVRKERDHFVQRAVELMAPLGYSLMRRRMTVGPVDQPPFRDVDVRTISYLLVQETLSMRDLAIALGVTPGRVTQIVDRLEALGHVVRERDAEDKRVWQVRLTQSAREVVDGYYHQRSGAVEATLEELSPAGRAAVVHFLEGVIARLGRIDEVADAPAIAKDPAARV